MLRGELMGPRGGPALSAITVQSMADLGYGVDVTQADAYTLPSAAQGNCEAGGVYPCHFRERPLAWASGLSHASGTGVVVRHRRRAGADLRC